MKKLLLALAFVCLVISLLYAADTWTIRINEVTTPSLKEIKVDYTLQLNGSAYISGQVDIEPADLEGKTASEKKALVFAKIKEEIASCIKVYDVTQGLKAALEKQEIAAK